MLILWLLLPRKAKNPSLPDDKTGYFLLNSISLFSIDYKYISISGLNRQLFQKLRASRVPLRITAVSVMYLSVPNTSVYIRVRILLYAKRYHSEILSCSLPIQPGITTCISEASLRPNTTLQLWIRKMPEKKNRVEYFKSIKLNLLIWRLLSEHQISRSNYSGEMGKLCEFF